MSDFVVTLQGVSLSEITVEGVAATAVSGANIETPPCPPGQVSLSAKTPFVSGVSVKKTTVPGSITISGNEPDILIGDFLSITSVGITCLAPAHSVYYEVAAPPADILAVGVSPSISGASVEFIVPSASASVVGSSIAPLVHTHGYLFVSYADIAVASTNLVSLEMSIETPLASVSLASSSELTCGIFTTSELRTQLPAFTMDGAGRFIYVEMSEPLPSLTLESYAGGIVEIELPIFEPGATAVNTYPGNLSAVLSPLNFEGHTGGSIEVSISAFTTTTEATPSNIAQVSAAFRSFVFSGLAARAVEGGIDSPIPGLQLSASALPGLVGEVDSDLLGLRMSGELFPGDIIQIEGTFGSMSLKISARPASQGDILTTFPILGMKMQSGYVLSEVLRYVKEKIR